YGTRSNACSSLASGCAFQYVTRVRAGVLEHTGQIGVTRAWARHSPLSQTGSLRLVRKRRRTHDLLPVTPVVVTNEHRDRRTERLASAHSAQEPEVSGERDDR